MRKCKPNKHAPPPTYFWVIVFGHSNRDPKEDNGAGGMVTGGFTVMGDTAASSNPTSRC